MEKRITEVVLPFYHFSKKLCIKDACRQRTNKHTKTLSDSTYSLEQVVPLDSTFHKDSNKI
jgi:hypothetical protein